MINVSVLQKVCKLKGVTCHHFDEDCITCNKRKILTEAEDDSVSIRHLLLWYEDLFERYYYRKKTRASALDYN